MSNPAEELYRAQQAALQKVRDINNDSGVNTNSKRSLSGVDIVAAIGTTIFGQLTGLTVSIQREKAPVYTVGYPNPWSYSRGKRGIAGAMTFVVFDRSALHGALANTDKAHYFGKVAEIGNAKTGDATSPDGSIKALTANIVDTKGSSVSLGSHVYTHAQYADQYMPFDVIVIGLNEYGGGSLMSVRQIEIVNENTSVSVDDIQIEQSMTYVATHVLPWTPIKADTGANPEPAPTIDQILNVNNSDLVIETP